MRCNNCGTDNNNNAKFCRACGSPLDIVTTIPVGKTCPKCGGQNAMGAAFCKNCGMSLSDEEQNSSETYYPETQFAGAAGNEMIRQGTNAIADTFVKMIQMLKLTFTAPKDAVSRGKEDETYWRATFMMAAIAGLIIAIINALDYSASDPGLLEELGQSIGIDSSASAQGGSSVFLFTWLSILFVAAAYIGIAFGIAKLFGSDCEIMQLAGGMFPTLCIMMLGIVLGLVFFAGSTVSSIICALVTVGLFIIWSAAILMKVFEEFIHENQTKQLYSFLITVGLALLATYFIMMIFESTVFLAIETNIKGALFDVAGNGIRDFLRD